MSVRDYIHPSWGDGWQRVREAFSGGDPDAPDVDDPDVPRRAVPSAISTDEILVYDASMVLAPNWPGDRRSRFEMQDGSKWNVTRWEDYERLGGGSRRRVWARREP